MMAHINFQAYLQARMSQRQPSQRYLPYAVPLQSNRRMEPVLSVMSQSDDNQRSMTLPPHPTFFEDNFFPNEHWHNETNDAAPCFRPLASVDTTVQPSTIFADASVKTDNSSAIPQVPAPGILDRLVDASAYTPVGEDELAQAEIAYDASSPASLDSHTPGPYTPMTDGSASFHEQYFDPHRDDSNHRLFDMRRRSSQQCSGQQPKNLISNAIKPNFFSSWNGQSSSAPASLPGAHLARPCLSALEQAPQAMEVPSGFPLYTCIPITFGQPNFGPPATGAIPWPVDNFSRSFSSNTTDSTHTLPSADFDTSDSDTDMELEEDVPEPTLSQSSRTAIEELTERRERDEYLLKMRNQGMSYKEIKRRGGFREAESTLRGRVRMLTKEKWERVRRPEWTARDVALLRRAVDELSEHRTGTKVRNTHRVPWKKVSDYIKDNGGTYHFAPATCARKWDDLRRAR